MRLGCGEEEHDLRQPLTKVDADVDVKCESSAVEVESAMGGGVLKLPASSSSGSISSFFLNT